MSGTVVSERKETGDRSAGQLNRSQKSQFQLGDSTSLLVNVSCNGIHVQDHEYKLEKLRAMQRFAKASAADRRSPERRKDLHAKM